MDPDRQDALSRHLAEGWWVLPLRSGRIAVWTHPMSQLYAIVDSWEDVVKLERPPSRAPKQLSLPVLDLEGLDL